MGCDGCPKHQKKGEIGRYESRIEKILVTAGEDDARRPAFSGGEKRLGKQFRKRERGSVESLK